MTQQALILDTILGMKRALHKENDYSGPDDPITQPTNRGNKLRANAKFVREGALGYIHPEDLYKQKIEHGGFTRYILQRNPVRYDSEGDELDDDDEDSEADAAAAEENPFSEIALENFMCPLKHPSELPTHPSMSHAYTSKAMLHMTQAIEAKLRQERALLWRARNLHRQFLGDSSWMACGMVETSADRWIFEPRVASTTHSPSLNQSGPNGTTAPLPTSKPTMETDGTQGSSSVTEASQPSHAAQNETSQSQPAADEDVEMTDAQDHHTNQVHHLPKLDQTREPKSEEVDTPVGDLPHHSETTKQETQVNGSHLANNTKIVEDQLPDSDRTLHREGKADSNSNGTASVTQPDPEHRPDAAGDDTDKDAEMQDDGISPEPPRRMTTRAQTNAANPHQDDESGPLSPAPSDDTLGSLPTPHPLFLIPESVRPDSNFGLPPNEAEDTRRLLWSYVQKQEETVRGFEHMLDCLLRACRMKEDVLEWCKAEGHVGELSDGEDWYDREKWGLAEGEDLKKGADEDEIEPVEESRTSNKRGRGRRA